MTVPYKAVIITITYYLQGRHRAMPTIHNPLTTEVLNNIREVAYRSDLTVDAYSGRFMYGAVCLGLIGSTGNLVRFIHDLTLSYPEISEMLADNQISEDSMGHDSVFYWTGLQIDGEIGLCDECGYAYETGNTMDHDAEEGLCWSCSPNRGPS